MVVVVEIYFLTTIVWFAQVATLDVWQSTWEAQLVNFTVSYIDFLSRPGDKPDNQINLVEIEHGLIVTPTECRKIGWVPIFASLEMPGKKW